MSKTDSRLGSELGSFYALIVINIIASAVAMGLSISYAVPGILAFVKALPNVDAPHSLPLVAIAIAIFGAAISWLVSSAEIFDEVQELRGGAEEGEPTSLIVKTLALYRARKTTFLRMAWVSKVTGIAFLVMGICNSFTFITSGGSDQPILAAIAIALNFAMGSAALYIPHLFDNFTKVWEGRLAQSAKTEEALRRILEGGA